MPDHHQGGLQYGKRMYFQFIFLQQWPGLRKAYLYTFERRQNLRIVLGRQYHHHMRYRPDLPHTSVRGTNAYEIKITGQPLVVYIFAHYICTLMHTHMPYACLYVCMGLYNMWIYMYHSYIYICMSMYIYTYVCMYVSVKMPPRWDVWAPLANSIARSR